MSNISGSGNIGDQETMREGPQPGARLIARRGPEQGHTFAIPPTGLLVGRAVECNLALNDPQVSRRHARFYWHGSRLIVEDLGSANGTIVNGVPVSGPHMLHEGDTIEIGGSVFVSEGLLGQELTPTVLKMGAPAPAAPPTRMTAPPTQAAQAPGSNRFWLLTIGLGLGLVALIAIGGLLALWYFNRSAAVSQAPPSATFIFPPNGAQVEVGLPVTVQASATDSRGVIRLELWADGVLVGQQTSVSPQGESPLVLTLAWTPSVQGSHVLEIRAFNVANQQNTPTLITVNAVASAIPASTVTDVVTATPEPVPSATPTATPPSIIIFTPTPSPTPAPSATPQPALQAVSDVNVRGGPGTIYPIIGLLRANDTAVVVGRSQDGAWWQIVFPPNTGGLGWVVGTYVRPNQAANDVPVVVGPPPPPTNTPVPATATPTPVPPTVTNTPLPPAEVTFTADRTELNQGECTKLHWRVRNVAAYWVDGVPGVGDEGQKDVCDPVGVTTHTLRVQKRDGSIQDYTVTITVRATTVPRPSLISPEDDKEFDYYPREVTFVWSAVTAPGTVTYNIEIQYNGGSWSNWRVVNGLTSTTYTMDNFVGANPGRWRVWATSSTLGDGEKTEWREFEFLQ
jgi:hypothetical protein